MKHLTRIAALAALATVPLASSVPAFAADTSPSQVVKYNDLNLTTPEGAKELYSRLKKASRNVCNDIYSPGTQNLIDQALCRRDTLDTAVRNVNQPLLTALHRGSNAELTASR